MTLGSDMEAQIHDIAISAGRVFLNPFPISVLAIVGLAVFTGVAGRLAMTVEDVFQSRRDRRRAIDRQRRRHPPLAPTGVAPHSILLR